MGEPAALAPMVLDAAERSLSANVRDVLNSTASSSSAKADLSIQELDDSAPALSQGTIKGTICFRCDHKHGNGFHVRISDGTGHIDLKFFGQSADMFRGHPALCKGVMLRVS